MITIHQPHQINKIYKAWKANKRPYLCSRNGDKIITWASSLKQCESKLTGWNIRNLFKHKRIH